MYSNLTKTNYEFKDMNLQELRDRIINENNLTPLDILKGFHAKSNVNLKYNSCLTEQNSKDIEIIYKKYEDTILEECTENLQKMYDAKFNSAFEEYKKTCPELTLQAISEYERKGENRNMSVSVINACWGFIRHIHNIENELKKEIEINIRTKVGQFIEENFGGTYEISERYLSKYNELPSYLNVNNEINIDFSNVYEHYNERDGELSGMLDFDYDSHTKEKLTMHFFKFDTPSIYIHLSEEKAKETFDNAINAIIYNDNTVGDVEYFQNLEAQPITININTKTNKYELIDGYKRLLFIADKDLLSHTAPVRVFTDLNDVEFLTLLYASNIWKGKKDFHDRGFLFALKTRFGFTIPTSFYGNSFRNELEIIQLYDFGGNLTNVDKCRMMNTVRNHEHIANDMKMMYNFLASKAKEYKADENMSNEIVLTIVELIGEARRQSDGEPQNELTEELITSIFEDSFIKELCSKKHLSTRTYVINYFRDKGIYKHIGGIIKDNIFIKK